MAIDPNISLSVQVPEPLDLVGARMKQMNLQQLSQQGQLRGIEIEQARLQQADQAKQRSGQDLFSRLLSQHSKPDGGVDSYAVEKGLAEGGYGQMAVQYGTQRRAESKVQLDNVKTQLENSKNRAAIVGSMAGSIMGLPPEQRPIAYARFIEQGQRDGLFKPGEMPPAYDENFVAQGRNQAIQANDQIANAQKDVELQLKNDEFKQKTAENSWKNVQEQTKFAAGLVAATDMNDAVQVAELKRTFDYAKVSPEIRAMLITRTAQQAMTMGMTPEQQAQAASTKAGQVVTMRGQDMTAQTAAAGQAVTMRGQNMTNALGVGAKTFANEGALRDDFAKESRTFVAVRDAVGKIRQAASSDSAAADIALIYGFMRILDPTSTVREGEFATAQNAGSIPDQVKAAYNKAINGGRLTANIRQDFVTQAEKIYGQAETDHSKTRDFYGQAATRFGMDPAKVLPDYSIGAQQSRTPAPTATAPAAPDKFTAYAEGPNGQRLGWNGSAWVVVSAGAK